MTPKQGWGLAAALAILWGVLPLLPAIISGELPGHGFTDLYPAVWGLGWFADHASSVLPTFAPELAAPTGSAFYYSSPLHGWLNIVTEPVLGLTASYTFGVGLARIATVLCAYAAARAMGLGEHGSLVACAIYGCAPFFHGYAVEGIIEGVDGWTLALWVALAARERYVAAAFAAALVVLSSWYLAMVGVLIAVAIAPFRHRASLSFAAGLGLASPALYAFLTSFEGGGGPLSSDVRAMMGTPFTLLPERGSAPGLSYAAKTSWLGFTATAMALAAARKKPLWFAAAATAWLLSLGVGPLYELPVWRSVRFPYRLHAATLVALAGLAGFTADRLAQGAGGIKRWVGPGLALLIVGEGLLLSPVEPILPSASAEVPAAFMALRGQNVLSMPGPLALPPGQPNPSRRRARYTLYWMGRAGTRTPWAHDFNGLGQTDSEHPVLAAARSWDRHAHLPRQPLGLNALREAGVDAVAIHREALGDKTSRELEQHLTEQGAALSYRDDALIVLRLSASAFEL